MTKTILDTLTEGELKAARILVAECLRGMGGKRPADLESDPFTWTLPQILIDAGYSRHEAAGFWSSLLAKGAIEEYDRNEWIVADETWRAFEAIW
jgi:hypothetical protein